MIDVNGKEGLSFCFVTTVITMTAVVILMFEKKRKENRDS